MQHTIVFSVEPVNQFGKIEGSAPVFNIRGSGCSICENTYSVSTNEENKKISASLDSAMPAGCCLEVNLSPPTGARSTGSQTLSSTPVDLIIELSRVSQSGLPMIYNFNVDMTAGTMNNTTRIVTYTLIDG